MEEDERPPDRLRSIEDLKGLPFDPFQAEQPRQAADLLRVIKWQYPFRAKFHHLLQPL